MTNLSVEEFKEQTNAMTLNFVKSPKTQKLFVSCSAGNFKCQGDIDLSKPVNFIHEEGSFDEGCFVNANTDSVIGTL